jgi:hypothetical protein
MFHPIYLRGNISVTSRKPSKLVQPVMLLAFMREVRTSAGTRTGCTVVRRANLTSIPNVMLSEERESLKHLKFVNFLKFKKVETILKFQRYANFHDLGQVTI